MKITLSKKSAWLVVSGLLAGIAPLRAQNQAPVIRCATMQVDSMRRAENPNIGSLADFEEWIAGEIERKQNSKIIGGVYQIPVVFHVVHNSNEAVGVGRNISFAAIQSQIDVLNEDFRKMFGSNGYNTHPDGADTQIEFCLAQRRPDGSAFPAGEPGVNRINRNTAGFNSPPYSTNYIDNTIKTWTYNNNVPTATRGWDPAQYMNIWICDISNGILGYAQFPESALGGMGCGSQNEATDGVVFLYNSIGKSSVTGFPAPYNEGRTATHEIGHWLGLRHIWGDGGCGVDDFCNDTPLSDNPNFGCPNGHVSCGSTDMIENYMDYTDDLCMNIFTNDQKMRMRTVLESSPLRLSLINSDACTPPNPSDAAIVDILQPRGDNCAGGITPQAVLKNRGGTNLTSAIINYELDNGTPVAFNWTGNLAPSATANVSLPVFNAPLGIHNLKVYSTLPNTTADPFTVYDTTEITFVISNGIMPPYTQDFDGGVFPPDIKWSSINPNNDCYEWLGGTGTSSSGQNNNASALMPNFGNNTSGSEHLVTPVFTLPCNVTNAQLSFDVAYRKRSSGTNDALFIDISEDCGASWNSTPIYSKSGSTLATLGTSTNYFIPSNGSDWRNEVVSLQSFVGATSKNVRFRFRGQTANGNNLYIDNFSFTAVSPAEIAVSESTLEVYDEGFYNYPLTAAGSSSSATFTVTNTGTSPLTLNNPITVSGTAFSLGTGFSSTTLAPGASTTFTVLFSPSGGGNFTGNVSFGNNDCDEGTYNFVLNGTGTGSVTVVADFSINTTQICQGSTATFTDASQNATSWSWDFGSGASPATATGAGPHTVTYSTSGSKTIMLTVNGSQSTTQTLMVNATPTVTQNSIGTLCVEGSPFVLQGGSPAGGTYSGTAVTGSTFSPAVAGEGSFPITYSYTDGNGCGGSAQITIVVQACASVGELASAGLSVFPNPSDGHFTIRDEKTLLTDVQVYDQQGKLVKSLKPDGSQQMQVDLSNFAAGAYTVHLVTLQGSYHSRIVVQH